MRVAKYGEEHELTIRAGGLYVIELTNAFRGDEARVFLTKLLATSKQVLGHHHKTAEELTKLLATSKQVLGHHHKTTEEIESTLLRAKQDELLLKWVNGIYSSKSVFVVCILIGVLAMSYQLVK